jgi:hypothetical protein
MAANSAKQLIASWPEESKEAATLVLDTYGEPHESTESMLIWRHVGPWKRLVASREFFRHDFPVPHTDAVESFIDYRVPPEKVSAIVEFDGSVVVERTAGEVSARCHDEQANFLALNLMHDIATGRKSVQEARHYYAREFLDYRRRKPTPYMEKLHFSPARDGAADPDSRVLTDDDLRQAASSSG